VRPESFKLTEGGADASIAAPVLNVAFEGNMSHIFLKGPTKKEITLTIGRDAAGRIPAQGETAHVGFDPQAATVLPAGKLASE
jgi:spermidine/putrescine transport system ATP-binding protein